jgi:hypothetical protein
VHAIRIQPAGRHAAAGKTRLCSNIQHRPQQRPAPRHNGPLSRGTSVKIKIERISGVKVESAESYRVFDSGLFYFYNPEESPVELGETAWAARGRTLQTKTALVVGWLRHSSRITFFVSPNSIQIVNLSTHKTRKHVWTYGVSRSRPLTLRRLKPAIADLRSTYEPFTACLMAALPPGDDVYTACPPRPAGGLDHGAGCGRGAGPGAVAVSLLGPMRTAGQPHGPLLGEMLLGLSRRSADQMQSAFMVAIVAAAAAAAAALPPPAAVQGVVAADEGGSGDENKSCGLRANIDLASCKHIPGWSTYTYGRSGTTTAHTAPPRPRHISSPAAVWAAHEGIACWCVLVLHQWAHILG